MFSKNFLPFSRGGGSNKNFPRIFERGVVTTVFQTKFFSLHHGSRGAISNKSWRIIPKFHTFSTKLVYTIRSQKITAQNLIFNCTNFFPNYTLCVWLHVRISPDWLNCQRLFLTTFAVFDASNCRYTIDNAMTSFRHL